jgi:putative copper export protein/mono/diheme cytochrome c family protein
MDGLLNGAAPAFGLDRAGLLLSLIRGMSVAAMLAAFGACAFRSLVWPPTLRRVPGGEAAGLERRLARLGGFEALAAVVMLLIWLPAEAATMAGAMEVRAIAAALPTVVTATRFGHLVLEQIGCLLAAMLALWRLPRRAFVATLLSGAAVVLQVGHSHAGAMQPLEPVLIGSDVLHLLAAGAWLGGLPPLLLIVRRAPPRIGAAACRWFSPLGQWCLVAMLATAAWQFWVLIGGLPGLFGTAYGWVAMLKMALYGVLFVFAWVNRYRLAPALLGEAPERQRRRLVRSLAWQTVAGLAVVLAAGLLSQLSPAMHTQAVWPFTEQPSLMIVREDEVFRAEVLRAVLALVAALGILVLAVVMRRRSWSVWLQVAVAAVLAGWAVPHLDLLFVPATPTTFYRSPTGFSTGTILAGAALYPQHCAGCHGAEGRGDGVQAVGMHIPPADLTAAHLWDHPDGELFWWLSHGMEDPEGGLAMPGFSDVLSEDDIWALIDFLHAHNAGAAYAATGAWPQPVPAPSFDMTCAGDVTHNLADLRGQIVRVVFGPATAASGVLTVTADTGAAPAAGVCVADDDSVRGAYAVVTGLPPEGLAGAEILIDGNGWLRAVHRPAEGAGEGAWLEAAVRDIGAHTLQAAMGGMHHH